MVKTATALVTAVLWMLWASLAAADIRLTEAEMESKLLYNTATIEDVNLRRIVVYFPTPGEARGFENETAFSGSWALGQDGFCLDVPLPGFDRCWAIILRGDAYFLESNGGLPAGRIYFAAGNPQGL